MSLMPGIKLNLPKLTAQHYRSNANFPFGVCGSLLEVHVPGLQGTALRALSIQFTEELLGLALVLLEVSS